MIDFHLIHPIINHLSIGLFAILFFAEIRLYFHADKHKNRLQSYLWILFVPSVFLSVATGLLAKGILFKKEAPDYLNTHENLGLFFLLFSILCGIYKLKLVKNKNLTSISFLAFFTVGILLLVFVGLSGGDLVFSHGIGVSLQK